MGKMQILNKDNIFSWGCHLRYLLIIMLSIGTVFPTDTLLTKGNQVYLGELVELNQTSAIFKATIFVKPQPVLLGNILYISSEDGQLLYGARPVNLEAVVVKDTMPEQQSLNEISGATLMADSTRFDRLVYLNGTIISGELVSIDARFVQFKDEAKGSINNLPRDIIRQIVSSTGEILYSSNPNNATPSPFTPSIASFGLIPGKNILLVLDDGAVKEVQFQKFYNDSLFYGEPPFSGVPLRSISSLWSEGQDITGGAVASSCGLLCGSCIAYPWLMMSIDSETSLLPVVAVPVAAAFLAGKRYVAKPSWHLVYRPEIPINGWDYEQGYAAGKNLASAKPTWFLPGFFYNFWAVQTSRNLIPCPPTSEMEHKSKAYVAGLIDGYSEQTSLYNTIYSSTGCVLGTSAALFGLLLMSMGAAYGN